MTTFAESHPEHSRGSCREHNPGYNADPAGSTGCARCTALLLDEGESLKRQLKTANTALDRLRTAAATLNGAFVEHPVGNLPLAIIRATTEWRRTWLQVDGRSLPIGDKVQPAEPIRKAHAYERGVR